MNSRILTVSSISTYNYKPVPFIRLRGKWLEKLGFKSGDKILLVEDYREITIRVLETGKELK